MSKILLCVIIVGMLSGCASLKQKCLKLNIGEGGNITVTAPESSWLSVDMGSITGTGPVSMESCPIQVQPNE